jgi:hypothetical protein
MIDQDYGFSGAETVVTFSTLWNWCSLGSVCTDIPTACQSGTLYWLLGTSQTRYDETWNIPELLKAGNLLILDIFVNQ